MVKVGKVVNTITDYARDALGLAVTGLLTGVAREVGAVIGIVVSPKIAATDFGRNFNRLFGVLCFVDTLLERFTPKGII